VTDRAVADISIALNPTIYRWARRLSSSASKFKPAVASERSMVHPNHCILVGYGPVGRIVYRLLSDRGASVTVIDLNLDTVRQLKARGRTALYGDVLRPGTLEEAGIATAGSLILSADVEDAGEIIRHARMLNPKLHVFARCSHLRDAPALKRAGASVVAAGEAEVGVALVEAMTADEVTEGVAQADQRNAVRERLYRSGSTMS
jgi:monovalent cation:H+ antiporter-2, CPA2 family